MRAKRQRSGVRLRRGSRQSCALRSPARSVQVGRMSRFPLLALSTQRSGGACLREMNSLRREERQQLIHRDRPVAARVSKIEQVQKVPVEVPL